MAMAQRLLPLVLLLTLTLAACDGDEEPGLVPLTPSPAMVFPANAVDPAKLPLGDGKIATAPERGSVFACQTRFAGGGAFRDGPWIKNDGTWDSTAKATVDGEVTWPQRLAIRIEGASRLVESAGLPNHATGTYPVRPDDDAFQYDRNPNTIAAQDLRLSLPLEPAMAAQAACLPMGAIGVLLTGSVFFNALDAQGKDAVAHELQDRCHGHPERTGAYHYHDLTPCLADVSTGHSALAGYAFDGFGIYGPRGEDGRVLSNAALDECHGHSHAIEWDGRRVSLYHYHATLEYPYTLGCFRGPAVRTGPPPP
ncbi:MAG TPA: YHYH protein [Dehalococcoidia bacterium]|nr:YHYH protein [Dehalococcoidia bacterium]